MKTVFYSAQFIAKNGGAQVAQLSGSMLTARTGMALRDLAQQEATDWYRHNGSHPLDTVSIHLVALNYI